MRELSLPQSFDAECGVLSSFLLAPAEVGEICDAKRITSGYFHNPGNALIYESLMTLWRARKPIDFIILTDALRSTGQLNAAGGRINNCSTTGAAYITELFTYIPTAANVRHYLDQLIDAHIRRELILAGTDMVSRCYIPGENADELLSEAEASILAIGALKFDERTADGASTKESVIKVVSNMDDLCQRQGLSGTATGFYALDKMTDGFHPGEMIVFAARPSTGKTALAMNIADHMAVESRVPIAVFSLEMSTEQLIQRMILSRARASWKQMREGRKPNSAAIHEAATKLANAPIYFNDKSGISMAYIGAVLRRWKKLYGIEGAIIDYIQLLRGVKAYKGDNRQAEVAEISGGIKSLAKELGIWILALSQLNRQVETRTGKQRGVPRISDLRESGALEQDADLVGLLTREEMYVDPDDEEEMEKANGKARLTIAKHRNGPTGPIDLVFLKDFTRFENRAIITGN